MAPEGLDGKVVLVTGSGCGLGASLARAAAERRARVVLNCRSDAARVNALAADLKQKGAALDCRRSEVSTSIWRTRRPGQTTSGRRTREADRRGN